VIEAMQSIIHLQRSITSNATTRNQQAKMCLSKRCDVEAENDKKKRKLKFDLYA